jgi:serine/threonine protein kinase
MSPDKIGRYEIKQELGQGGMATVYQAYDPNFERDVAIKVLPHALLHDPQFRARFEREAKMIAMLEHPAIVPVYDFGEQDGQPFIVMRYMSGGSLSDVIKRGPISAEETSRFIARLAPALDVAHSRGIIHRDLKPGNVLYDQYGNAFLSDFGIAHQSQENGLTLTGTAIVGTPAYMSPEQIQGEKNIDGRSDIYALGILVYQMLTGQTPYHADTPGKLMMMHVLEPVPQILAIRGDLPPALEPVMEHALAKQPADRFGTAGEFSAAFDAAIHCGPAVSADAQIMLTRGADVTMISVPTARQAGGTVTPNYRPITGSLPQPVVHPTPEPDRPPTHPPTQLPRVSLPFQHPAPTVASNPLIAAPAPTRRLPWIGLAVVAALLLGGGFLVAGGLAFMGSRGSGPLAMLLSPGTATPSAQPSPTTPLTRTPISQTEVPVVVPVKPTQELKIPTPLPPTDTPLPTDTATPLPATPTAAPPAGGPVIGGADKIAFIKDNELWVANLDGTELVQLTKDGGIKSGPQWSADGQSITFITGKCVQSVDIATRTVDLVACFNFIDALKAFVASPDGSQVAISLDNQMYLVPYDRALLSQVKTRSDLTNMAPCKDFAPYKRNFIVTVRWSRDGSLLAAELLANLGDGRQGNIIQVFAVDQCIPNPVAKDNFPQPRFVVKGYAKHPFIQSYSWDGLSLFALTDVLRNDGFGDLFIYNMELKKARLQVNPVDNHCCYRDPQWSPDGSYLLFAFQDIAQGSSSVTRLYYVLYGSLGADARLEPLPLPDITDPRAKPQAILRPAPIIP